MFNKFVKSWVKLISQIIYDFLSLFQGKQLNNLASWKKTTFYSAKFKGSFWVYQMVVNFQWKIDWTIDKGLVSLVYLSADERTSGKQST